VQHLAGGLEAITLDYDKETGMNIRVLFVLKFTVVFKLNQVSKIGKDKKTQFGFSQGGARSKSLSGGGL
jgi:hypothetical protein